MGELLDLADRIWTGAERIQDHNPFQPLLKLEEVVPGVAFLSSFANVAAVETGEGLVLFDTGSPFLAETNHQQVRGWSSSHLHTAIYTHGHIDHACGVGPWDEEAAAQGRPAPRVVAHRAVAARFDRYRLTAGYNTAINRRQFRVPGLSWPTEYRYPDTTYDQDLVLEIGGERFELHHALGETDDHTWTWMPSRRVLFTGDLVVWVSPNCGNPQKVQRYPREWAAGLRRMAALEPDLILPGHGFPIAGRDRAVQALSEAAQLLEGLVEATLAMMNAGATLDEIVHTVQPDPALSDRPYLQPIYDEPEFIVRNLWRLYGGWYDGNPANLKPAPEAALAGELAALAGGAPRLAERALELSAKGEHRLACHIAELAWRAAPDLESVKAARAAVYRARGETETSLMARSIFNGVADPQ